MKNTKAYSLILNLAAVAVITAAALALYFGVFAKLFTKMP